MSQINKDFACEYCGNYVFSIRCESCGAPNKNRNLPHLIGARGTISSFGSGYISDKYISDMETAKLIRIGQFSLLPSR